MISTAVPAALLTLAAITGQPRGEVLDFSATWCGPCQQMSPIVSRLERQGYPIRKVDVDANRALAERFGVSSIPAFVLVVDGREVTRIVGAVSEQQLVELLSQIPNDPPVALAGHDGSSRFQGADQSPARNTDQVPRPQSRDLTQPVAAVEERPSDRSCTLSEAPPSGPKPKPSLIEKLFGQDKPNPAPSPADVVRANLDNQPPQSANVLPVHNPVEASVRLHVTINGQKQMGSGTAIDSRPGQTLIATCGHLFNGWNDRAKVEADVFVGKEMQRFVGRMVHYDLASDVGIIGIPTDVIMPIAEVADAADRPQVGDAVVSIGCSGGAAPSQEPLQVTALNFYEGPDNVECTGVPVQGRSGGGLFNRQGQLVGLCIAADADRQRGAYAGLLAIHDLLTATGLQDVYQPSTQLASTGVRGNEPAAAGVSDLFGGSQTAPASSPLTNSAPLNADASGFAAATSAATEGPAGDAEVICIIRSRQLPDAPSRVVIIDRPSAKFLSYLDGELAARQTAVRTNRFSSSLSSRAPATSNFAPTSTRFSIPPDPAAAPASAPPTEQSRSASLQPTSLSQPFRPQQYVRSPHAR